MKKQFSHKRALLALLAAFTCWSSAPSYAQTITVDQPLSFGRIVLPDFSARGRITIRANGTYTTNVNLFVIEPPTRGEYTLTGGPANTVYTITVPLVTFISGGPGGDFELDNMAVRPNNLTTNASGEDQFRISGRLRSLGGGVTYGDGTYSDTFDITINF